MTVTATLLLTLFSGLDGRADPAVSQAVNVMNPIVDELGRPLVGTDPSADQFGLPVIDGDLVQILQATDGVVHPPDVNGNPDPRNVLLTTIRIGRGLAPTKVDPGLFSGVVAPRPGGNSKIFARVFNAPALADASFFGDSQLFTVKSFKNELFTIAVTNTSQALDGSDPDGDGLNNSWEKSYGSDPNARDTDGDGLSDAGEVVAGTDLLDAQSDLAIADVRMERDPDRMVVSWLSVTGRTYDVQFVGDCPGAQSSFACVSLLAGNGDTQEYQVPIGQMGDQGWYRVCVRQSAPNP